MCLDSVAQLVKPGGVGARDRYVYRHALVWKRHGQSEVCSWTARGSPEQHTPTLLEHELPQLGQQVVLRPRVSRATIQMQRLAG